MENHKPAAQLTNAESLLCQQILQCAAALEAGQGVRDALHNLIKIAAASNPDRAIVNCGSARMEAIPFGDMLVIRALGSEGNVINAIDMSYNTAQSCFVAKPSITGRGM